MNSVEREPRAGGCSGEGTRPETWDWRVLDEALRPRLVRTGLRFGFRREEAEDLVQDVFQAAWAKRPRARNPQAYLVAMFYNRCRDRAGQRAREDSSHTPLGEGHALDARLAERIHAACAVEGAFRMVGPSCRTLIESYCVMRKSLAETAAEAGSTVNAVWKRIDTCLKRMRLCLAR